MGSSAHTRPGALHCRWSGPPRGSTYELRLGEDRFGLAVSDGALEVARGGADRLVATFDTDPGTLLGALRIDGDRKAAERLIRTGRVRTA